MGDLSLAALSVLDAGPLGQVRAAKSAGFSHVGLRLQPLLATDAITIGDVAAQDALLDLLAQTGVQVLEIGVFPLRPDSNVEAWGPTLAFSHRIGARYVVCPVEDTDPVRRLSTFRDMCDLAETCALEALIEFNPYSGCRTLQEAADMVAAAGRDNARLLIDALHLSRSGGSPADVRKLPRGLAPLVHLCDAPPPPEGGRSIDELRKESRTARLLPGEGSLWLGELLEALGPDVDISVEAPTARDAHLPANMRAQLAFDATKALLARREG